jgi:mRNA interferase MazF
VIRGEIWLVALDPALGSEIQKSRLCVVVSPSEMHDHLRTVIVAPMTTKSRAAPFRIPLTHAGQRGLVQLDQIRAVDKARLVDDLEAFRPTHLCRQSPGCAKLSRTDARLRAGLSDRIDVIAWD